MSFQNNIPITIKNKMNRNLHMIQSHPICIIKELIYQYFDSLDGYKFDKYDNENPIVTIEDNFDKLLIDKTHPARSMSDTYYVDGNHVLRTHTSAHQNMILESASNFSFLVTGDVYRKDEIDSTHYPVFHQMEGVYIYMDNMEDVKIKEDLIGILKGLCNHLFPECEIRVNNDYFPFTNPSYEIEVYYNGKWLEILGCGIIQPQIINNCSEKNPILESKRGWAFGLGLERLAMILFGIPDIRLMWVESEKFTSQFKPKTITKYKPYSQLDKIYKDLSFYIPNDQIITDNDQLQKTIKPEDMEKYKDKKTGIVRYWRCENDLFDLIRDIGNMDYSDVISEVKMFDQYYDNKKQLLSRAYRIYYEGDANIDNPSELNDIANIIQNNIVRYVSENLGLVIR